MRIAVAIDPWKRAIFERHLTEAGFTYEVTVGSLFTVLKVETEYAHKLAPIVEAANFECARKGKPDENHD